MERSFTPAEVSNLYRSAIDLGIITDDSATSEILDIRTDVLGFAERMRLDSDISPEDESEFQQIGLVLQAAIHKLTVSAKFKIT